MNEASSYFQRAFSTLPASIRTPFAVSDVYRTCSEKDRSRQGHLRRGCGLAATTRRIPENRILSHDLLEGNYARSGLVTDVEVVEQYPVSYEVAASRSSLGSRRLATPAVDHPATAWHQPARSMEDAR